MTRLHAQMTYYMHLHDNEDQADDDIDNETLTRPFGPLGSSVGFQQQHVVAVVDVSEPSRALCVIGHRHMAAAAATFCSGAANA